MSGYIWRHRIVVSRDKSRRFVSRWKWAVEEQRGARGTYELKNSGTAFTRVGAIRGALNLALGVTCEYERVELEVAGRRPVSLRPPPPPTPLPVELLELEGAE